MPPMPDPPRIGIITVSDRAARGEYEDRGGPAIHAWLTATLLSRWEPITHVVTDDQPAIESVLCQCADIDRCVLIVTTGGTGPAVRDVTPDATEAVCDRMMPGFGEAMRAESLRIVPTAILSRQTAGTRGQSLIVNLPGQPKAVGECLGAIFAAVPYCIELMGGPRLETDPLRCDAFRPKSAR